MSVTENPNAYDEEAFTEARNATIEAVAALFKAGAKEQDIVNDVKAGLYQAGCEADVEIDFKHIAAWVVDRARRKLRAKDGSH